MIDVCFITIYSPLLKLFKNDDVAFINATNNVTTSVLQLGEIIFKYTISLNYFKTNIPL